jgi:hypothetical protein
MSRTVVRRALVLAAAAPLLAGAAVLTAPAALASLPTCTSPGATVLTEFDAIGLGHTRIATYSPSGTETDVCVQTETTILLVAAFTSNVNLVVPSVTTTPGTGGCATTILNMTAPIALSVSVGEDTSTRSLCIGKDGVTTTIAVATLPGVTTLPTLTVGSPAYSYLAYYGWCAPQYAAYDAAPTAANSNSWQSCYSVDHAVTV